MSATASSWVVPSVITYVLFIWSSALKPKCHPVLLLFSLLSFSSHWPGIPGPSLIVNFVFCVLSDAHTAPFVSRSDGLGLSEKEFSTVTLTWLCFSCFTLFPTSYSLLFSFLLAWPSYFAAISFFSLRLEIVPYCSSPWMVPFPSSLNKTHRTALLFYKRSTSSSDKTVFIPRHSHLPLLPHRERRPLGSVSCPPHTPLLLLQWDLRNIVSSFTPEPQLLD